MIEEKMLLQTLSLINDLLTDHISKWCVYSGHTMEILETSTLHISWRVRLYLVSPSRYQVTLTGAQYHMMCSNVKPMKETKRKCYCS